MSDYGLQITGTKYGQERVLFDSRDVGRGTYQSSKGTLSWESTITAKVSDLLLINLTRPTSGTANVLVTAEKTRSGDNITWKFYKRNIGPTSLNTGSNQITGLNYVILKTSEDILASGTYGLQCSAYGGGITFDSRMFTSSEGEVQLDPTQAYSGLYGHGSRLAQGWNGADRSGSTGDDYYSAFPLEKSSWTGGSREYGYLWSTESTSGTQLHYGGGTTGNTGNIFSSASSNGSVYQFSELNNPFAGQGNTWIYPVALSPTFAGRATLGTYDPQ